MQKLVLLILSLIVLTNCQKPYPEIDQYRPEIRINQIGYYPNGIKKIVLADSVYFSTFSVIDINEMKSVFDGNLSEFSKWELSGEKFKVGNFSDFKTAGEYVIYVEGLGYSYPFKINHNVFNNVLLGSVKGLYYQRASIPLEEKYAGKWHRPEGHPDDHIRFHPSTGKDSTLLVSSPGGWYDAGDYNKYVINAAFPLGQYFQLWEQYPEVITDNQLAIPESGNKVSDFLDELKYELDWLLTMQDQDGGLFHKLTTKNFEDMIMPHKAVNQRYIVGKGTAATLNFAAAMAQAHRIYKKIDATYAQKLLTASESAWNWAIKNPNIIFQNPKDVHTGEYGDTNFDDEFIWASAELFLSTGKNEYLDRFNKYPTDLTFKSGESWTTYMKFLGVYSLLNHKQKTPDTIVTTLTKKLVASADDLTENVRNGAYFQPISDFTWGSNSDILNAAMLIAQAYRQEAKPEYLKAVQQMADYIFGKNAVGYSFLTGFGEQTPMNIHHRQSASDGIEEPVPGLLSGGASIQKIDTSNGVVYPNNVAPMKSWVDQEGSYVTNEICLNWNAPLTYVLGFLEQESN